MNSVPESLDDDEDFGHVEINLTSARKIFWNVRNFKSLPKDADYSLDSQSFTFENATWCLRVYPNKSNASIGMTIVRLCSSVPHHRLYYSLTLVDKQFGICRVADFDEDIKEYGAKRFITRSYAERNLSTFKSSDILKLVCVVSRYGLPDVDAFSQTELWIPDTKDIEVLCQNFKNVLLNGQSHDVVLKVKDKEFRAHKDILRGRSPVFEPMLSHDMIEKNSGTIDIPDCDPSAFEQFLIYLYSGKVDTLDTGNMLSLYYIADKYDMGYLKEQCREFIKKSLSSSNITDVVQTALDHSDADLLRWSTDYFVKEAEKILPTVEWMSFLKRNAVQANELIIKAVKNERESKA